jgi:hypothetical protein
LQSKPNSIVSKLERIAITLKHIPAVVAGLVPATSSFSPGAQIIELAGTSPATIGRGAGELTAIHVNIEVRSRLLAPIRDGNA